MFLHAKGKAVSRVAVVVAITLALSISAAGAASTGPTYQVNYVSTVDSTIDYGCIYSEVYLAENGNVVNGSRTYTGDAPSCYGGGNGGNLAVYTEGWGSGAWCGSTGTPVYDGPTTLIGRTYVFCSNPPDNQNFITYTYGGWHHDPWPATPYYYYYGALVNSGYQTA